MLQYKIPQNIGIEDKIVGPFSLRQLIILAVGGGISYVIFAITSRIYELNAIEYFVIALPAVFALMLAVIKVHNVSFGKYILLTAEFALRPKKRMWNHRGIAYLVEPEINTKQTPQKETAIRTADEKEEKKNKSVNLSDLSMVLDSGGFDHLQKDQHEDIDKADDDDLITEAYFGNKQKSKEDNMYWRTKDMQKKKLDLLAKIPAKKAKQEAPVVPAVQAPTAPAPVATPDPTPLQPTPPPIPTPIPTPAPEKKDGSVVQDLAKVIQEARTDNQTNTQAQEAPVVPAVQTPTPAPTATPDPTPVQTVTPAPTAPKAEIPMAPAEPKKKKPRKRKPKTAQPVRQDVQINNTEKNAPKLIPKQPKEEETSIGDLKRGGEIEINLN